MTFLFHLEQASLQQTTDAYLSLSRMTYSSALAPETRSAEPLHGHSVAVPAYETHARVRERFLEKTSASAQLYCLHG